MSRVELCRLSLVFLKFTNLCMFTLRARFFIRNSGMSRVGTEC